MPTVLSWDPRVVIQEYNDKIDSGGQFQSWLDGATLNSEAYVHAHVRVRAYAHGYLHFNFILIFYVHVHAFLIIYAAVRYKQKSAK